jgi:hypothetical protein
VRLLLPLYAATARRPANERLRGVALPGTTISHWRGVPRPGSSGGLLAGLVALTAGLALLCTLVYSSLGLVGLLAVTLPPALLGVWARRSIRRARSRLSELELANGELRRSNGDLRDLFEFAAGLAAQNHDSRLVADYAQSSLGRLIGGRVDVAVGAECRARATPLRAGGRVVGDLIVEGGDGARWQRLSEAIESQLATSLESATLAEEVRTTHLATIAALTRSIEAKDSYTGGHTERVSVLAVALARRLGYSGPDLDAIAIGALLHDVGKISIPETILHKPGPLDNDEWTVMKRHPIVSEFILSGADLSPIVLQIARSSHERMDGRGYPDGLAGEEIPLPARIVLVADAFDAITSDRPYRRARRPKAGLDEVVAHAGAQFCPLVVSALERLYAQEPELFGSVALTIVA